MKRPGLATLAIFTLGLGALAQAEDEAALLARGTVLLSLEEGTRMRLVHLESGERVALRGAGLAKRELPEGTWRVRRLELDSLRERMPDLPKDQFQFRVSPNRITYIGSWTVPATLLGGSLATTRGRPTSISHTASEASCACTPDTLAAARERWPAPFAEQELVLACAGRSAPESADAEPFWEQDCRFAP